jgi:Fe-S-cluster containining protein
MPLNCENCFECEDHLWGSFYPGEEWKMKYFEGYTFLLEGVWFFHACPHQQKDGKCGVHDVPWRPIQCQMYPCYINYEGDVEVDSELCPKAKEVDEEFKAKVKKMYDDLDLSHEQLRQWGLIVSKWSEPAKRLFK